MHKPEHTRFVKISATGNDFILFDNRSGLFTGAEVEFFHKICQRRSSVGADGILLIERSPAYAFNMRYFNADGYESEMCGNGARGAALYAHRNGLADARMVFTVGPQVYEAEVNGKRVKLKMPPGRDFENRPDVVEEDDLHEGGYINTGVPHWVLFSAEIDALDVLTLGGKYRQHPAFSPNGVNVDFVQILGEREMKIRTYERGVEDETLACGTGCVAAAIIAATQNKTRLPTEIQTRGGLLKVSGDPNANLYLEGEVDLVYEGRLFSGRKP